MQLNEGVEWAAHCATVLAALPEGFVLCRRRDLGANIPRRKAFRRRIWPRRSRRSKRAGIVQSTTGRQGGYRLGRPAEDITLLDIVQAIEGHETFFRCTEIRRRGPSRVAARLPHPNVAAYLAAAM